VDGVIILDKPSGITSNSALQEVRKLLNAQKGGHTGSLDPLATGVLPLCFGEATKFSRFLLNADKTYQTTARLGIITDSGDSDGAIIEQREVPTLTAESVSSVVSRFIGKISQVPTMYSALKHQGRPLYEWARKGIEIERASREINIHGLKIIDVRETELDLEVSCSKGTYIRTLVEDIGLAVGCGAHVTKLRRIKAGHFDLAESFTLENLKSNERLHSAIKENHYDDFLLPVDCLLHTFPSVNLDDKQSFSLSHGQTVKIDAFLELTDFVKLYHDDQFLGVGSVNEPGVVSPLRLLATG